MLFEDEAHQQMRIDKILTVQLSKHKNVKWWITVWENVRHSEVKLNYFGSSIMDTPRHLDSTDSS